MAKQQTFQVATPKLKLLYEKHRYKVLSGGRGSAKSWGIAQAIIHYTNTYNTRVLCCREIQKSIQESAMKLLEDTIERMGLLSQYEILKTTIRNRHTGSEIIFEGLKANSNKIKSMEGIDICWVEEAETVSEESWKVLIPTIRKPASEIWISFNPRYAVDPTYKMFVTESRPDSKHEHFTYEDNPYFPDDLRKEMEDDKETNYESYEFVWLGIPLGEEYNTFITPTMIKESNERTPYETSEVIVAGLDPARFGDDSTAIVIRKGNTILHHDQVKKMDNIDVAEWAIDKCVSYNVESLVVDCDNLAGVYDFIRSKRNAFRLFEFHGAYSPEKPERCANMRAEVWDHMRDWIRETGKLPKSQDFDELTQITYFYNNKNVIQLESKEQMRRRGVPSPNLGDALAYTFYSEASKPKVKKKQRRRSSGGFLG